MQRSLVTALLLSGAATCSAMAQPSGYYYYAPQAVQASAAQPYYQQQYAQPQYPQPRYAQPPQYAQPQYAPPPQPQYVQLQYVQPQQYAASQQNMGGGFLEFIFGGGQGRQGRAMQQPQPVMQAPYVAGQPVYAPQPPVMHASLPPPRPTIDPRYLKQVVDYLGNEPPGTIVINTPDKFLYLVRENGKALRYGIGVGRPGFTWAGTHEVTAKREWPDWRPPKEMLQRRPELPNYMEGGPDNPLGARALYLGSTLYRIHGSNEPWSIGQAVSSGCIRMVNEDVMHLYDQVTIGTRVVVQN